MAETWICEVKLELTGESTCFVLSRYFAQVGEYNEDIVHFQIAVITFLSLNINSHFAS